MDAMYENLNRSVSFFESLPIMEEVVRDYSISEDTRLHICQQIRDVYQEMNLRNSTPDTTLLED